LRSITRHTAEYRAMLAWLRDRRREAGLSMRELAARMKLPHSWVGKIETGERRLDLVLSTVSSVTYSRNRPRPSSSSSIYGQNEFEDEDDDEDEQVSVTVFAATST
jgi:transcriptional regulator with XRE-family HTH domain